MNFRRMRNKTTNLIFAFLFALLLLGLAFIIYTDYAAHHVVINEVMSDNFSAVHDDDEDEYCDYIELYNPSYTFAFMDQYYLSDKEDKFGHQLDSIRIAPRGYYVIWCDGADYGTHADFKISAQGETLYLKDIYDRVTDSVTVPALEYDTVYARSTDGSPDWEIQRATCGSANDHSTAVSAVTLEAPEFSAASGFYDAEFTLEVAAGSRLRIYYTLDSSDPTPENGILYDPSAGIEIEDTCGTSNVYASRSDFIPFTTYTPEEPVDKCTVVRAIACDPDTGSVSPVTTGVYFVGYGSRQDYDGYAVMALTTDPDNLFGYDDGIYVNGRIFDEYAAEAGTDDEGNVNVDYEDSEGVSRDIYSSTNFGQRGREWEREASAVFFDSDHTLQLEQQIGIRIAGGSSRNREQKAFELYARDIYSGTDTFEYPFFGNDGYDRLRLRNGGSDNRGTKFLDPFCQSLAEELDVGCQRAIPCVTFLDGEYWGLYSIREQYDDAYFEKYYDVSGDDPVYLVVDGQMEDFDMEGWEAYEDMLEYIADNDMDDPDCYAQACELVDMDSLADFLCLQFIIGNSDIKWDKNMALWRCSEEEENGKGYRDGRWRFLLRDLDLSCSNVQSTSTWENLLLFLDDEEAGETLRNSSGMLESLLKSRTFSTLLMDRYLELTGEGGALSSESVREKLAEWSDTYRTQVICSNRRFVSADYSEADYEDAVAALDSYFTDRYAFLTSFLKENLNISE